MQSVFPVEGFAGLDVDGDVCFKVRPRQQAPQEAPQQAPQEAPQQAPVREVDAKLYKYSKNKRCELRAAHGEEAGHKKWLEWLWGRLVMEYKYSSAQAAPARTHPNIKKVKRSKNKSQTCQQIKVKHVKK